MMGFTESIRLLSELDKLANKELQFRGAWECPRCHKIYGPAKLECTDCNSRLDKATEKHP